MTSHPQPPPQRAQAWLGERFTAQDFVVLDTETNGLGKHAEVIELGVVSATGEILFESLLRPLAMRMNPYVQRVHGISLAELRHAPKLPELLEPLSEALKHKLVLAWNAPFDRLMLEQSYLAWNLTFPAYPFACAMKAYAMATGHKKAQGGYSCKLDLATEQEGVRVQRGDKGDHRAAVDALRTLKVLDAARTRAAR